MLQHLVVRPFGFTSILLKSFVQNSLLHPILHASFCSDVGDGKNKFLRTYNILHPPKDPPEDYNPSCMEHEAFDAPDFIPAAIFRPFVTNSEILGPGADKNGCYKNPEYYSYHRYSFVALQMTTMKIREERIKDGGVSCIYDDANCEKEEKDCEDDNQCCS